MEVGGEQLSETTEQNPEVSRELRSALSRSARNVLKAKVIGESKEKAHLKK